MQINGLTFKTKPWEHQLAALEFLMPRDFGGLYTDAGTGKSKVFVDLIANRGFKRVIISGTKKPCETWVKQFKIHAYEEQISATTLLGLSAKEKLSTLDKVLKRTTGDRLGRCEVIIVNYDSICLKPISELLIKKFKPDCVICDESHRIKSAGGTWSRYFARLGKVTPCRYILSGTMIAEDPLDAYGQFRFMEPSIFGSRVTDFKSRYHNIDPMLSAKVGFPILDKNEPYKNMDEFYAKFWEHVFRIPSSVKLPSRKSFISDFNLNAKGGKIYNQIVTEGAVESKQGDLLIENALSKVVRRQQATSGFIALTNDENQKKLFNTDRSRIDALKELIEELPIGEPVVVFAKFTKDLRRIRQMCKEMKIGYSEISGKEDTEQDWQEGKTQIIGVQYQSGSESVDLTRARYCVYYSLVHSYTLYYQSKKRIHRPHQTRPCVYYHMAARYKGEKTIDHQIIDALRKKQNLVKELENGRATLLY